MQAVEQLAAVIGNKVALVAEQIEHGQQALAAGIIAKLAVVLEDIQQFLHAL